MGWTLTFKKFIEPGKYLVLQENFRCRDPYYAMFEHNKADPKTVTMDEFFGTEDPLDKIVRGNFEISCMDTITGKRDTILLFYEDFLIPMIENMFNDFKINFEKELKSKLIIEKERIKFYAKLTLKDFHKQDEEIKKTEHLEQPIKDLLLNQWSIIVDYLSNVHIIPNYLVKEKVKFRLRRNDIVLLFLLMREHKLIDVGLTDSELGNLIDGCFLYHDQNEEKYKEIKNSRKTLGDFKNESKTVEKSLQRLKDIFGENFFELP